MFRIGRRARAAMAALFLVALALGMLPTGPARAAGEQGAWSATGSLATARSEPGAITLANGKVLVTGGRGSAAGPAVASAELYNPDTGTWSPTGAMATARVDHTVTLLPGGDVLVTGGTLGGGSPLASAERYHPATGTWTAVPDMPVARRQHTATRLNDGKVLVVGTDNTANLYNPDTNAWSAAGTPGTARYGHTATALANGKVLVAGGQSGNFASLASAELYDPATNSWSVAPLMEDARYGHTAVRLANGKVLVVGGSGNGTTLGAAELYDPAQNSWLPTGSLGIARANHSARPLANGRVLVIGGSNPTFNALASSEIYDPVSGTWTHTGGLLARRNFLATVGLTDGRLLAIGGADATSLHATVDIYDPNAPSPYFSLSVLTLGPGNVTGNVPGQYLSGTPIGLTALPLPDMIFVGWYVNGTLYHWYEALDLAMTGPLTVGAAFAQPPAFADVPPAHPAHEAITQLAARGIIQGYGNGNFGPGDTTLRAQMAALIARPFGWDQESHPNPFVDRGSTGDNLWASVAALAHYNVTLGYDGVHFGPNNQVTRAQTISFIARAMVAKGFWESRPDHDALFANVPASSGHRQDLATYDYYAGTLPGQSDNATFPGWSAPATRGWFAQALWQALNAHYNQR